MRPKHSQAGIALMIVLLVVTIATVLSTAIAKNQSRTIGTASSYFDRAQAYYFARGGETFARQLLFRDFKEQPERDDLTEEWAALDLVFEYEGGEVQIYIEDLQGRFNLNQFVAGDQRTSLLSEKLSLMTAQIGLDPAWMDDLLDYTDVDGEVRLGGAEDYFYLGLDQPFRTSGQPLQDLSEIRMLRSMSSEGYARLSEVLTVTPAMRSNLNVNTAPAMVLQTLASDLSLEQANALIDRRTTAEGFDTVQAFLQQPELAGLAVKAEGLGVQSSFFKANIKARYENQTLYLTSFIYREPTTGEMTVYKRINNARFAIPLEVSEAEQGQDQETNGA